MNKPVNLLKSIVNVIFVLLVVLLIIVTVTSLLTQFGGAGSLIFGKYGFGRIVTGSMEPDLPTGSFVLVKKVEISTLQIGDVIMFFSDDPDVPEGMPVSHAIVRVETDENGSLLFITKGTANDIEDMYPVRSEAVIGKVVWHSMTLGSIVKFSQQSYVYPILIVLLGINLILNLTVVVSEAKALRQAEQQDI